VIKRLALNTASNLGTLFLKIAFTFIMTPILIKNMGNYDYGLWEMIGAVIGYMGMLDLGIRPAVSRFAARFIAQEDDSALVRLYATAWYFLLFIGLFVFMVLAVWGVYFPGTLAEKGASTEPYMWLMVILALQLLITFPAFTAESYMEAYQEYYLKNNITIINTIIGNCAILYFVSPDNALVLLAAVNAIGIATKYIFYVWYMHWKRPFLSCRRHYFSLEQLKTLFKFSIKTVIQGVCYRIETATDSLVIGIVMSPAAVPLYSVPANLINYLRLISFNATHVFMPYFSGLTATGEKEKIVQVYLSVSKITAGLIMVLGVGVFTLGEEFLRLWVGNEIAESYLDIRIYLVAFTLLPMLNPYANRYLTAIDKHGVYAKWQPIVAIANLVLSLVLIGPMGIAGVALGSLIPGLIFQPFLLWYCCQQLEISVLKYIRSVLLPISLPLLGMYFALSFGETVIQISNYVELFGLGLAASCVYLALAYFVSFSAVEKQQFKSLIRRKAA
jgi:O-antigen/teichoic acid export membrane protein